MSPVGPTGSFAPLAVATVIIGALVAAVLVLAFAIERASRRRLAQIALSDPVTGGLSWPRFEGAAAKAIRTSPAGTYMLVTLNLVGFKLVNDAFGSERGDAVLRHIARSTEGYLCEGELMCRTFADHFILLVRAQTRGEVLAKVEGLACDLNRFNEGAARTYYLALSVGAYPIDDPSLPLVQIRDRSNVARLNAADSESGSLYTCGFYSDEDRVRLRLEKEMGNREADLVESGELVVHYQPKLDLRTRKVAGAEALVRWNVPGRGLVLPGAFVPFYEKSGYVARIDLFVFEQACGRLRAWIDGGVEPVPVSFNLSRAHLGDPSFLDAFEMVRKRFGVPARLLDFELTETLLAGSPEAAAAALGRIRDAGYRTSIDDFGSGLSSLGMLKDAPADTLKLDREFLRGAAPAGPCAAAAASGAAPAGPCLAPAHPDQSRSARSALPRAWSAPVPPLASDTARPGEPRLAPAPTLDPSRAAAVVESVVAMARRLGMEVVCEGVESASQLDQLAAMGCDLAQGFAVAPALPPDEFERMAFGRVVG
ncbi:bifunctional diguanylate cyclase/phosphodiesterase [Raoultibacter phocaeensis]|uniref:bifunctional diguanylate cyclase/phosphodiesterase n=1 Tax=Raoultibacter phocaeensis TaxID=2479841 RepID=UPI0015D57173|nr:bifunctional diguanylate cyclase/phosphodiesterase [Raoultibacter phocaeensis]